MKKTLLMAAVLVFAACGKKADTPAADTTSAVAEPAPAQVDTAVMHDSAAMHTDSAAHSDSTVARDSAAH